MRKFVTGDVVTDGKRTGTIVPGFHYRKSDDGTMNEPKSDFVPVVWDNNTQGYHQINKLEYA